MNEQERKGIAFEAESEDEKRIWESLAVIDSEDPSPRLRQRFYHELERASRPALSQRLAEFLGFARPTAWLTAAGFGATGMLVGLFLSGPIETDGQRLAALESNVQSLNKRLVLDRIENESATKRLRGVIDAVGLVNDDPEVVRALLSIAAEDRVYAVRTAAIDALGPGLDQTTIASEVMGMLETTDSPHVQLALIDMVLRHGTAVQVGRLVELAEAGTLYPALATHVRQSTGREIT